MRADCQETWIRSVPCQMLVIEYGTTLLNLLLTQFCIFTRHDLSTKHLDTYNWIPLTMLPKRPMAARYCRLPKRQTKYSWKTLDTPYSTAPVRHSKSPSTLFVASVTQTTSSSPHLHHVYVEGLLCTGVLGRQHEVCLAKNHSRCWRD